MSAALRKGWCPGALRPMAAKDGLIVRLRLTGGILSAATAHTLADLAARHGNGLLDLSARGNLQLRGISERALPALQHELRVLGLIDVTADAEAVRNVISSPLAGLHDGLDIRPLVAAMERRLAGDPALHALPPKFGFLVDDGSRPTLAGIDADVRFDWTGTSFSIGLGGTRVEALRIGTCGASDLVGSAAQIAEGMLALRPDFPEARRMRALIASAGHHPVVRSCGGRDVEALAPIAETIAQQIVGYRDLRDLSCLGLAAPFGRLDAAMLRRAAEIADSTSDRELRLTPWRVIVIPGATAHHDIPGFITDPDDPRLAVAACVGATGCARGSTDTQADATALASIVDPRGNVALHVSGCEKGCAKPSPTAFTLVARDGRYDLIRDGRANGKASATGLDLAAIRRRLEDLRALA